MGYSQEAIEKKESLLPEADVTRQRVREYRAKSGMTGAQFASMVGLSVSGITMFLNGTYGTYNRAASDVTIRHKLEAAMQRYPVGLLETEAEGTLYETENVADLRHWFNHCHQRRALAFCYGPPGSQKTFVLKHLVSEFNRHELQREDARNRAFYVRGSINIRPRDLMAKLCVAAGAASGLSVQRCMSGLRVALRNTKTLFVVDEAQLLSIPCLEALRELHDEDPNIGSLLAGSHTLKQLFERRASELEQWNSRLDAGIELRGVSQERARLIIRAELPHLSTAKIEQLIEGSFAADKYSRTNTTYLNVRRLFKNIEAYKLAAAQAQPKAGAA